VTFKILDVRLIGLR